MLRREGEATSVGKRERLVLMAVHTKKWVVIIVIFMVGAWSIGSDISIYSQSERAIYVALTGSDDGKGTQEFPYRSITKGLSELSPGDTLLIGFGVYEEKVELEISGEVDAPITLIGIPDKDGKLPIITQDTSDKDALLTIHNQSHIVVKNLHFKGNNRGDTPMGIFVEGEGSGYYFDHIAISEIESDQDAHGMAFYGTDGASPLENIIVQNSRIYNCRLGSSEALVFNGNVSHFLVENNQVYNNNNIGIDCIGFEGTAPDNDQARNGVIRNNWVHHITSTTNVAYDFEGSAGGIYVDGGKSILIENNKVTHSDIGIEVASEHKGKVTDGVKVINNRIAYNTLYGIAVGGASKNNGYAIDNVFKDNVLVSNAVDIAIQQARENRFQENAIYTTEISREGDTEEQAWMGNHWFTTEDRWDAGDLLQQAGIIQGINGNLLRDEPMTREELITVIWRLRGEPTMAVDAMLSDNQGPVQFDDVPSNHWAAEVINWSRAEGITLGIGNNQFGLGQSVTLGQVQLFMERTLSLLHPVSTQPKEIQEVVRRDIFEHIALAIGASDNPYQSIDNDLYKLFQIKALLAEA